MREFKYVVTDPEGIHARPAGEQTLLPAFPVLVILTKDSRKYHFDRLFTNKQGHTRRYVPFLSYRVSCMNLLTASYAASSSAPSNVRVTSSPFF